MMAASARGAVKSEVWGTAPGMDAVSSGPRKSEVPVKLFTLSSANLRVQVTEFGARIVSVQAPDRQGRMADVVLGYSDLAQYVSDPKDYFGAVVGRYGNRIANGTFTIDGVTYHVPLNNNGNALHGGTHGFSSKVWHGRAEGSSAVVLTLVSEDGDMGFPGKLTVHVRYSLSGRELRIDYSAETTKATVVNLTNHSYFNLAGEGSGTVLGQQIRIDADRFTPVNERLIPKGDLAPVDGTPFDFRELTPIGRRIDAADAQLRIAGGYDHNYVLDRRKAGLQEAAFAVDPESGRTLTVLTTQPGVQFYSGNFLNGSVKGFSGKPYDKHDGFCLETQHFPDSPNHPGFPSTLLRPGKIMHSTTVFVFGVK